MKVYIVIDQSDGVWQVQVAYTTMKSAVAYIHAHLKNKNLVVHETFLHQGVK